MLFHTRIAIAVFSVVVIYSVILVKRRQAEINDLFRFSESLPHIFGQITSPSWPSIFGGSEKLHLPHIQDLCSETVWTPNLWLHCHKGCGPNGTSLCGGLNNARNRITSCLRMAIDAGAGLIIPPVAMRGDDLEVDPRGKEHCADTWWDLRSLQDAMAANCPQLQMRVACEGLPYKDAIPPLGSMADKATIEAPPQVICPAPGPCWTKGAFRKGLALPAILAASTDKKTPTIIRYADSFLGWNYRGSDEMDTIRKELHLSLPFRAQLLGLGDTIARRPQLGGGAFIGVHLRGESDWPSDRSSPDQQMAAFEEEMLRIRGMGPDGEGVSAVYVSSGDQQAIQNFRERLEPLNFTVHDKWTILKDEPKMLSLVNEMDFDSMGVIDYQALVRAEFFIGVLMSTMSAYIAYTRTANHEEDFFDKYIFPDVNFLGPIAHFPEPFTIRGNNHTSLLVTDGQYYMDSFP
ncbi:hypothetical protein KVR01_004806 [Diaporthe batatas]|uniref:uncharacterized protein n=1 Tax=Diaporthe batatas TaxID=748121 RepID=UPI001D04C5A6|nr:uncharacterized protein KVR01_004806 [Diaporthe batatas]KAG8166254.1 hypothetical protein KVR01_004806 [Diaporthe batatas]